MEIIMLGHKRIPSREGGIEIVVEELSVRMARKGHSMLALNRKGGKSKPLKTYKDIELKSIPTINTKQLDAFVYSLLASIYASASESDIVHYHALGPSVMSRIPKLFGKKIIVTVHGLDWQRAKWSKFATWYLKLGEKIAAKYADEIIVLSKNVQQYFLYEYGRQVNYIPNGINPPAKREADLITEQYGLKKNGYILFLARIVPEKGLHTLIKAFRRVKTDKNLVIAGGSSHSLDYYTKMEELASKDERVIMTGFVQGKVLEELYSNALLYVLPSEIEGMPLSLLEAMSYGNCCVVSDIPENVEVVQDFGVKFRTDNVSHLTETISDLLKDEARIKEYRRSSSNYILNMYNWDNVVDETLDLYKSVLKREV